MNALPPQSSLPPSIKSNPTLAARYARARALFQVTILENPWIPQDKKAGIYPKQAEFLCYEGAEALFGGSAGGGKSVAILMAALQFVEWPNYRALILRRTFAQLQKADSIMNKSKEWIMPIVSAQGQRATWNESQKIWRFPSGATIEFGHVQDKNDVFNYQGGAWHYIGVDECTQFTEDMISYPRSRLRRGNTDPIPLRWRGASNPGGIGHEHIKKRYVKDAAGLDPSTPDRQYFPCKLRDNPHINEAEYRKQLMDSGIDPITLQQLIDGNWDAVPGGKFAKSNARYYTTRGRYIVMPRGHGTPNAPTEGPIFGSQKEFRWDNETRFMMVDPAASVSQSADYTVCSVFSLSPWGDLIWLDCERFQAEIPEIVPRIAALQRRWGCSMIGIEGIGANVGVLQLAHRHRDPVLPVERLTPQNRDKLNHAATAMTLWKSNRVYLPASPHIHHLAGFDTCPVFPLDDVESELVRFTGVPGQDAHDDVVDTLSYAAEHIANNGPTLGDADTSGVIVEMDTMPGVMQW